MNIELVDVTVWGEFGAEGEPASHIEYEANLQSPDRSKQELEELIKYIDKIAEVHNTLRKGIKVSLNNANVSSNE